MFWKVRTIPSRATLCPGLDVISTPLKITVPTSPRAKPVMQLKSVVFPAPFGPIKDVTEWRFTSKLTSVSAFTPPKLLETPWIDNKVSPPAEAEGDTRAELLGIVTN